jgi:hypothetical protein
MVIKKYINKKGEEIVYEYDQKKYSSKFYEKNKALLQECTVCDCGGKYKAYNKSHHLKTKKHLKFFSNDN